jgi:hypothetical protein
LRLQAQPLHEPEYLVKWSGRAHIHNEWLPESTLLGIARRKLLNFKKRHGDAPVSFAEEEWSLPERFVARRPSPSSPGWEVLVKWQGQVRRMDPACWSAILDPRSVGIGPAPAALGGRCWSSGRGRCAEWILLVGVRVLIPEV